MSLYDFGTTIIVLEVLGLETLDQPWTRPSTRSCRARSALSITHLLVCAFRIAELRSKSPADTIRWG